MDISIKSPEELQRKLGEGTRAVRVSRNLTQQELAAKAGLSHKSVAKLERGEGSAVETLIRVLHALKATDFIENLVSRPTISPMALLKSPKPAQRVRHPGGRAPGP